MNTKPVAAKSNTLLRLVEERIKLRKELEENQKKQLEKEPQDNLVSVPYLPEDCISSIIVRLPLESLQASRFACKSWYEIVNSPSFVADHLQRADLGLILLTRVRKSSDVGEKSHTSPQKINFSVESKVLELQSVHGHYLPLIDPPPLFNIMFMELKDGKTAIKDYNTTCLGKIKASCDGLIILENRMKKRGLIVLNPVTRDLKAIPLGTKSPTHHDSYGFAFCKTSSLYKLVHLFQDELQYIGCEIMNIESGLWRAVDGPPFGYFGWLGYEPNFAMGALHWFPLVNHNEYIVSMRVDDEKFQKIPLPETGGIHDYVFEMMGYLGFVRHKDVNQIDIWILQSLGGENWEKLCNIASDCPRLSPLYYMRSSGELVCKCKNGCFYAYNLSLQLLRKFELDKDLLLSIKCFFPHMNSLVSWKK